MSEKKEKGIEELFQDLDEIIKTMENSDTSLEKSFELYKEGVEKLKLCGDKIEKVESELKTLDKDN